MSRSTSSGMRLRGDIHQPLRYEDEDINFRKPYSKRNGSKPAFPELLAAQTSPFNPHQRLAAFPSLPLTGSHAEPGLAETQDIESDEEIAVDAEPHCYSSLDLAHLLDEEEAGLNKIDFAKSNNLAARFKGVCSSGMPQTRIKWSSLHLAYQYRIFNALTNVRGYESAGKWLGLSVKELRAMRTVQDWRMSHPVTLTQIHEGQRTLDNCLEPEYLMKHVDLMVHISYFELGSPHQLLDAGRYLQQQCLPLALLGKWVRDPLGSDQLIDISPLTNRVPIASLTANQMQHLSAKALRGPKITPSLRSRPRIGFRKRKISLSCNQERPTKKQKPMAPADRQQRAIATKHINQSQAPTSDSSTSSKLNVATCSGATQQANQVGLLTEMASKSVSVGPKMPTQQPNVCSNLQDTKMSMPASSFGFDRSSGGRNAGSMSLRNRGDLKETRAIVESRENSRLWVISRNKSPEIVNFDIALEQSQKSSPRESGVQNTQKKGLFLQYDDKGSAFIATMPTDQQPVNLVPAEASEPVSPPTATQCSPLSPTARLPAVATPPEHLMDIEEPPRRESLKREVVFYDLTDVEPARFGEPSNFDTKLILSSEFELTTRRLSEVDATVEADAEEIDVFLTPLTHPARRHPGSSPILPSDSDVQSSPLNGRDIQDILPTIEGCSQVNDPMTNYEDNRGLEADCPFQPVTPKLVRRCNAEHVGLTSPPRPKNISPVSENEDDPEYQSFLRGERERGPAPLESFLCKQGMQGASTQLPISAREGGKEDVVDLAVSSDEEADADTRLEDSMNYEALPFVPSAEDVDDADPIKPELKIKLKVRVPEHLLSRAEVKVCGRKITTELEPVFPDPGEEGDISWAEDEPKRQKRKTKISPKTAHTKSGTITSSGKDASVAKKGPSKLKRSTQTCSAAFRGGRGQSEKRRKFQSLGAVPVVKPTAKAQEKSTTLKNSVKRAVGKESSNATAAKAAQVLVSNAPPAKSALAKRVAKKYTSAPEEAAASANKASKKTTAAVKARTQSRTSASNQVPSTTASSPAGGAPLTSRDKYVKITCPTSSTEAAKEKKKSRPQGHRPLTRAQTPVQAILELERITIHDSASEPDSEASSKPTKSRKQWTAKEYTKTRESSRLATRDGIGGE